MKLIHETTIKLIHFIKSKSNYRKFRSGIIWLKNHIYIEYGYLSHEKIPFAIIILSLNLTRMLWYNKCYSKYNFLPKSVSALNEKEFKHYHIRSIFIAIRLLIFINTVVAHQNESSNMTKYI